MKVALMASLVLQLLSGTDIHPQWPMGPIGPMAVSVQNIAEHKSDWIVDTYKAQKQKLPFGGHLPVWLNKSHDIPMNAERSIHAFTMAHIQVYLLGC